MWRGELTEVSFFRYRHTQSASMLYSELRSVWVLALIGVIVAPNFDLIILCLSNIALYNRTEAKQSALIGQYSIYYLPMGVCYRHVCKCLQSKYFDRHCF